MSEPALPGTASPKVVFVTGLLSFVAGFVDVVGFVALMGLFTAHVTGNFVLIGAELIAESTTGVLGKLLALPVFILFVASTRLAVLAFERNGRSPVRPLLGAEVVLLTAFLAIGLAARPIASPDAPLAILSGMAGVAAMAVQNAKARLVFGNQAPTTIMTGNTTQAVIDVVDLALPGARDRSAVRSRLARMLPGIATFAIGAIAGALGFAAYSFWCLLAPIVALVVLIVTFPVAPDARRPVATTPNR
jgi:uncharacterized membrane protein YoaK (UPF0700 family)